MANVRDLFFPLFAYGLAFEQMNGPGQPQQSYAEVRRELSMLWEELRAAALSQGMGETDFLHAAFAPVAWLDETILKHPTWEHRNQWRIAPLQLHYYKTRRADETFFERLAQLRPEQTEIREIYYLCLRLGFTGQYSRDIEAIHKLADGKLGDRAGSVSQVVDREVSPPSPSGEDEQGRGKVITPEPRSLLEWVKTLKLHSLLERVKTLKLRSLLEQGKTLLMRLLMPLQSLSQHVAHIGQKGISLPKQALGWLQDALMQWRRAPWLLKAGLALLIIVPLVLFGLRWFSPSQQFQLTVAKEGDGSGTLTASPGRDRSCDPSCAKVTYAYAQGTVVTLQATPDAGSIFEKWKEAECAQGIALNANKTCTAIFSKPALTVEPDKKPVQLQTDLQPCAKIRNILSQNSHVAEEVQAISKHREGINPVNDPLQLISSSFCDILDIIVPSQNGLKEDFGLEVSLDKPGPNPIYINRANGETLLVRVKTPTKFASYIYIDYYTVSDQVVHLFPNPRHPVNFFGQPTEFTQMARFEEPFGLELVTVIASKTPLFTSPRLGLEQTQSYITELQKAWPKDGTEIATTFYFITTQGQ
jgi:type IV/VI secretion system ImpK/VasF family protein